VTFSPFGQIYKKLVSQGNMCASRTQLHRLSINLKIGLSTVKRHTKNPTIQWSAFTPGCGFLRHCSQSTGTRLNLMAPRFRLIVNGRTTGLRDRWHVFGHKPVKVAIPKPMAATPEAWLELSKQPCFGFVSACASLGTGLSRLQSRATDHTENALM